MIETAATLVVAVFRDKLADYVSALFYVYSILIIGYILTSIFFNFGGRVPYSRWSSAILGFLRDICEPYLRIFRRFIPALGPLDLSPIIALFVLNVLRVVLVNLITP